MKPSELLRKARVYIENKNEHFICFAISKAFYGKRGLLYEGLNSSSWWRTRKHINDLLYPENNLNKWLVYKGVVDHPDLYSEAGFEKLRLTRLAWIDDMIAYWEARGE